MMIPGTDGGIDKTTKKEQKADEQYSASYSVVKSMSSSHSGGVCHKQSFKDTQYGL